MAGENPNTPENFRATQPESGGLSADEKQLRLDLVAAKQDRANKAEVPEADAPQKAIDLVSVSKNDAVVTPSAAAPKELLDVVQVTKPEELNTRSVAATNTFDFVALTRNSEAVPVREAAGLPGVMFAEESAKADPKKGDTPQAQTPAADKAMTALPAANELLQFTKQDFDAMDRDAEPQSRRDAPQGGADRSFDRPGQDNDQPGYPRTETWGHRMFDVKADGSSEYTVREDPRNPDTLWSIAREVAQHRHPDRQPSAQELVKLVGQIVDATNGDRDPHNDIRDPDRIYPGQLLKIPPEQGSERQTAGATPTEGGERDPYGYHGEQQGERPTGPKRVNDRQRLYQESYPPDQSDFRGTSSNRFQRQPGEVLGPDDQLAPGQRNKTVNYQWEEPVQRPREPVQGEDAARRQHEIFQNRGEWQRRRAQQQDQEPGPQDHQQRRGPRGVRGTPERSDTPPGDRSTPPVVPPVDRNVTPGGDQQPQRVDRPSAPQEQPQVKSIFQVMAENFKSFDKDNDGFISGGDIDKYLEENKDKLKPEDVAKLRKVKERVDKLEELSNDELGDENDGMHLKDLEEAAKQQDLVDYATRNFDQLDTDGDGQVSEADIDAYKRARSGQIGAAESAMLDRLREKVGDLEEAHNDEWFDENDGFTKHDLIDYASQNGLDVGERPESAADPTSPLTAGMPSFMKEAGNIANVKANFKQFDADGNGHVTEDEIGKYMDSNKDKLSPEAFRLLERLKSQVGNLEELSNDETGDENDGFTEKDLDIAADTAYLLEVARRNFDQLDTDGDGHVTEADIDKYIKANGDMSARELELLKKLKERVGDLEEANDDEWGDENDGFTKHDLLKAAKDKGL